MTVPATHRTARVEARIAPEVLAVAAAQEAAHRTIEDAQVIRLSVADQVRFAEALLTPPAPSKTLDRAAKAHAQLIGRPA